MRMLLRVQMETEAANRAIRDGSFPRTMERLMRDLQPEAAYFTAEDGKRTGFIVFDMKEPSDMPVIAEPLFIGMQAAIHMTPCMNGDDLQAGLERLSATMAPA